MHIGEVSLVERLIGIKSIDWKFQSIISKVFSIVKVNMTSMASNISDMNFARSTLCSQDHEKREKRKSIYLLKNEKDKDLCINSMTTNAKFYFKKDMNRRI